MNDTFSVVKATAFAFAGEQIIKNAPGMSIIVKKRRFRALSESARRSFALCGTVSGPLRHANQTRNIHCWTCFLKCYDSEHQNSALSGADRKTFRKRAWKFVNLIADLKIVSSFFKNLQILPFK